jgi:8-oxo-dGTP pyrophosphatase MutT (NUDIX family)
LWHNVSFSRVGFPGECANYQDSFEEKMAEITTEITPIPSATVTLVRDAAHGPEVLLMQRNLKSGFVPGAYVFPGGALDEWDNTPAARELCSGLTDAQASGMLGIATGGLAYWIAAIRESFEEAGLLLAYDAPQRILALDDTGTIERFARHRHALNKGACNLADILRPENVTLAADQLVYSGHWITPLSAPRRYDTRFFVAAAPPAQEPLHDNHETISHVWIRPADAIDRHRCDEFKMRFPTVRTLEGFAAYDSVEALMAAMRARHNIPSILPHIKRDGAHVLPGEPGYDDTASRERHGQWKI